MASPTQHREALKETLVQKAGHERAAERIAAKQRRFRAAAWIFLGTLSATGLSIYLKDVSSTVTLGIFAGGFIWAARIADSEYTTAALKDLLRIRADYQKGSGP